MEAARSRLSLMAPVDLLGESGTREEECQALTRCLIAACRTRVQVPFTGRYINLDRSTERRARLEKQLRVLGIEQAYSRFSAVDGSRLAPGPRAISHREYACFASHVQLLKEARSTLAHLHVLEDDALLSPEFVPVTSQLIDQGVLDEYDLVYTDIFVSWDPLQIAALERARRRNTDVDPRTGQESLTGVSIFDLHRKGLACTSSYLVSQRSLARVTELLEGAMVAGATKPVDLVLRDLVDSGVLKAACIVPFVTSVALELATGSTIHGDVVGPELARLACTVVRHTFFVRPDWAMIDRILERYFPPGEVTPRRRAVGRIMNFFVSGNAQSF